MGLLARDKTNEEFEPIPEDLHPAVCYAVWDIGTQFSERFGRHVHKVVIGWELPDCRADYDIGGTKVNLPRSIHKKYTLSLHKLAELRKDLEGWRGRKFTEDELRGFDLKRLIGVACQIQVLHNRVDDRTYSNITAIIKAQGPGKIQPERTVQFFSFEDRMEIPAAAPRWIQDLIRSSEEAKGAQPGEPTGFDSAFDDEVPF